jgi:hypothetical protein
MRITANQDFRTWLAIAGAATLIIGVSYVMVQQSTRLSANDAPLALAQYIKNGLENGASPNDLVPASSIDLRNNNNLFAVVTDGSQDVLASSAKLDDKNPLPPKGVFIYTKSHGSDNFTWQPAAKVRLATYVLSYGQAPNNGFIVTGQSLNQYEKRIQTYTWLALAAWTAALAWTFMALLLPVWAKTRPSRK